MAGRPGSIVEALLLAANRSPEKECIRFEGVAISYSDLLGLAIRWAGAFRHRGLAAGDRVALFLDNGLDFVGAYFGAQLAGAIVVLVNTQYRQVELRHILSDAGVRVCVVDGGRCGELSRVLPELPLIDLVVVVEPLEQDALTSGDSTLGPRPVLLTVDRFLKESQPADLVLPAANTVALIGYTSGTTGPSKGAMLTHDNLASNSIAVRDAWRWSDRDVLLLTLPLFHIHGLGVGLHGSLVAGGTVDLRRRFDASDVYDALLSGTPTMFFGVPTIYTRLIAEARVRSRRPAPMRLYVSGSAPLSAGTFAEFEECFGQRILERYGMTETIMNLTNPYDGERRPGTVGGPFPGQEARIVDLRTRDPIEDGQPGEIQVRGPHVFTGYWKRPEATAEAFDREGWFSTGDLGWRSADGYFTISGRARELIITGGYNVYPREVEEVLVTYPGVAEAAVFGVPDREFGESIVAAIVCRPGESPRAEDIVRFCRDQLASYKKPRQLIYVEQLPRNALGKVQKHVLRSQISALTS